MSLKCGVSLQPTIYAALRFVQIVEQCRETSFCDHIALRNFNVPEAAKKVNPYL